jgi:branched-chain amino acid transport system substrate-binding protein
MKTPKLFKIVALLVVAVLMITACGKGAPTAKIIKIYASWPMQGAMIPEGTAMLNAAKLALEQVNNQAGGYKLELVFLDDASPTTGSWDGTIEAENAQKCVNDPQCMVYFGTYNSGAAKISIPINNKAGIAQITPANTYPGLTRAVPGVTSEGEPGIYYPTGTRNYFRTHGSDDLQGAAGAAWAKCMGFTKVYILDDRQLYGKGIADAFEKRAEELGLEVLGHDGIESVDIDFRALLTKVKATSPQLVYAGVLVDSGGPQIAQQMDALGMFDAGMKLMSEDAMYSDAVFQAVDPAILDGNLFTTFPGVLPDQLPTDVGKKFYADFKAKYGSDPLGWASYAYNSTLVIIDSINRAATKDRAGILKAMTETKNFSGITGPLTFDANGDPTTYVMSGFVIKAGKYTYADTISGDMTCK